MRFKRILSLGTAFVLSASLLVGCQNGGKDNKGNADEKAGEILKVGMVTDVGGVNDQSFNQSSWEGLKKAQDELGVDVRYLESNQDADYAPNLETLVDEEYDLIIGVGFKMADAVKEAAKNYPDYEFAIVDFDYEAEGQETPENVNCLVFNEQEASYLVGLIAGKMTKTNSVGFIGGMEVPVIQKFRYGYEYGVNVANPDAKSLVQFANSFTDAAKGKSIANQMYANGADVIFTAAGNVGTGAIEAAKETNKYAIGVDRDQNDLAPKNVITSAMKRVDVAVYNAVKDLKEGNFNGGNATVYGLKEDGVGIAPTSDKNVSKDILDYVNEEADKVRNGEVKVPGTKEEYDKAVKK